MIGFKTNPNFVSFLEKTGSIQKPAQSFKINVKIKKKKNFYFFYFIFFFIFFIFYFLLKNGKKPKIKKKNYLNSLLGKRIQFRGL